MASVRDKKIAKALFVLFLAYNAMKQVRPTLLKLRCYALMAFMQQDTGCAFHELPTGWMDCRDASHAVLWLYCCVIAEYKVNWLMGVSMINLSARVH